MASSDKKDSSFLRKQLPALRTTDTPMPNVSPSRSRTDPPAPEQQQHDRSHLHRRLHSNSIRHRAFTGSKDHHHRHKAKETVQSAIELKPPISFDTLLRRDKKSPDPGSRSATNERFQQTQQQRDHQVNWAAQHAVQARKKQVRPQDVKRVRDQNEKREEELRDSLKSVEETAMSSTRQLDDTYYSILEKASILRSTVASLQQLAEESRRMHSSFNDDTNKLVSETKRNLASFGNFEGQEKTINSLVSHLRTSKDRTSVLNDRLEAARNRIEAYEKREKEKQKKRRKNWWIVWGVLLAFVLLVLGVWTAKHRSTVGTRIHSVAKVLDEFGNELASPVIAGLRPTGSVRVDGRLERLFDEL